MTNLHLKRLDAARARLDAAKRQFTLAAQAGIRGDKDAAEKASAAFRELNTARDELRRVTDQVPGPWGEMAKVRDELHRKEGCDGQ